MNALERRVLLVWFVLVLLVLVTQVSLVAGVLGTAAGVALGLPAARTRRALRRGGSDALAPRGGVRLDRVGRSVGAHLASIALLVLVAAVVPGLRDRFVALCAATVTAFCATVVVQRLRQG